MIKSICFIANHKLTYFYNEIALGLKSNGVSIYWIVPSPKQYVWLSKIYSPENLLLIDLNASKSEAIGDFNIHELLYSDRSLKYDMSIGHEYLVNIQKPIFEFIQKNNISYVFGETTWSFEVLIHRVITKTTLKCKFLSFTGIRIPTGRFAFFEDEGMNKILEINHLNKNKNLVTREIRLETPDYLKKNDQLLKKRNSTKSLLSSLWNFITFKNADKGNPSRPKQLVVIKKRWDTFFNRRHFKSLTTIPINNINDPFVFVTLHQQPEASVDIVGMYYDDQKQNIINLWRKLPLGWKLVVKEHSNSVGCRGSEFFKEIINLPNLILAKETESSIKYLEKCRLVVSVSGTVCYEALLLDKVSFLFGEPFFVGYGHCYNITLSDIKKCDNLESLIIEMKKLNQPSKDVLIEFVLNNSFEGIISNPESNLECMSDNNILKIANAIKHVIN